MRLTTWNCQPGLASNWDVIEELGANVIAIQEARSDTEDLVAQHDGWACIWQEGMYYPGLAVLARKPFKIEGREASERFSVWALIAGPVRFRFVNFWAMTPRSVGGLSYTQQARRIIEGLPDDDLPTVVAGDFNHSKYPPHLENVRRLEERGLVSAYHKFHPAQQVGQETERTRYARGRDDPSWHIDLVFVPESWTITSVDVGTFERYPGSGRGDHAPVTVTIGASDDELRFFLRLIDPRGRDVLRRLMRADQHERDEFAAALQRHASGSASDLADLIDLASLNPGTRRRLAQLLGELEAP